MYQFTKTIKYNYIIPSLIQSRNWLFKNRNANTDSLPNLPSVFFIVGSGRNGSTLLALLLNRHDKVFLPPEQFALPYSIMKWHLFINKGWDTISLEILRDFANYNQNWEMNTLLLDKIKNTLWSLNPRHQNYSNIFKLIFSAYGQHLNQQFSIVGDHSPLTTVFYKYCFPEFKDSKYIFLIRHPYDVILSYSKLIDNPASDPNYAVWKWNNSIKAYDWLNERYPQNIILISYEDLVLNTNQTMRSVISFLNLPYRDTNNLHQNEASIDLLKTTKYKHHDKLHQPISSDSIGNWKQHLEQRLINQIRPKVQHNAIRFRYDDI